MYHNHPKSIPAPERIIFRKSAQCTTLEFALAVCQLRKVMGVSYGLMKIGGGRLVCFSGGGQHDG
jgi:hypothetical protein